MSSFSVLSSVLIGLLTLCNGLSTNDGQFSLATIQQFPYFASIEINGKYACAATIIDDKYVMTTNSCVEGINFKSLAVRAGTSKQGFRGELFKVIDVRPYKSGPFPSPSPPLVTYDLAMVKVAVSFTYDTHVMWANPNEDGVQQLQEGTIVGWADTKTVRSPLVSASVTVLPSANCSQIYAGVMNISSDMYCLWPKDSNSQSCFADLGAPFYDNEQYYGIVTYSPGCSDPSLPVVITGISKFTSFIIVTLCDMADIFRNTELIDFPLQYGDQLA